MDYHKCPVRRVVISKEEGTYVAVCLERDIAAQGDTPEQALYEVQWALAARIAVAKELGIVPFDVPEAPPEIFQRFEQGKIMHVEFHSEFPTLKGLCLEVRTTVREKKDANST